MDKGKFGVLPPEIGQLQQLRFLDVANMDLKTLPVEIGALKKLQNLDINGNKLETLPAEITELKNLKTLNLLWQPTERPARRNWSFQKPDPAGPQPKRIKNLAC